MKNLLIDAAEDADVFDLDLSAIFGRGDGRPPGAPEATIPGSMGGLCTTGCTSTVCSCANATCMRTCGGITGMPCAC